MGKIDKIWVKFD